MPVTKNSPALYPLFSVLTRLETELWDVLDARVRQDCDIPLGRCEAMLVMADSGACRVFDIASALAITVGGASKLVDRIEAAGYCVRKANPEDRRSSLLELTPQGIHLARKARAVLDSELEARLSPVLTGQDVDALMKILTQLRQAVSSLPGTVVSS